MVFKLGLLCIIRIIHSVVLKALLRHVQPAQQHTEYAEYTQSHWGTWNLKPKDFPLLFA